MFWETTWRRVIFEMAQFSHKNKLKLSFSQSEISHRVPLRCASFHLEANAVAQKKKRTADEHENRSKRKKIEQTMLSC